MNAVNSLAAEIQSPEEHSKETGSLIYGDLEITYDVIRTFDSQQTRQNRVVIKVHSDRRVVAIAPADSSEDDVYHAMLKRARWIWQNLQDIDNKKQYVVPRQYVSGETCFYMGKRYLLKVTQDKSAVPGVKLTRGRLMVTLKPQPSPDSVSRKVKSLLENWYLDKAKAMFHQRLAALLPKTDWIPGIPSFRIQAMKTQWGSCSTQGNLLLNPHLIKAPKDCIDYVILHELCHVAEHNHSDKFWRLMTSVMPNWAEVKAKLDGMGEMYLNE